MREEKYYDVEALIDALSDYLSDCDLDEISESDLQEIIECCEI